MKKALAVVSLSLAVGVVAGCAGNGEMVKASTTSNQDVFKEILPGAPAEPGYVDLKIFSSLKTHAPGFHTADDSHGTRNYIVLVKIDGQGTALQGRLSEERSGDQSMNDPEEGDGIRYRFSKNLRVKTGDHKIAVSLPADDLVAERELVLSSEGDNELIIEPVYGPIPGRQQPGYLRKTSFSEGMKAIRLLLNGKAI